MHTLRQPRLRPNLSCFSGAADGFTLLEIILALALVGIIGTIAIFGLLNLTRGFSFVKGSGITTGKAQLAMLRLSKEFSSIKTAVGDNSSITYTAVRPGGEESHTVSLAGSNLLYDGDILTDQVNSFSLTYYNTYDGAAASNWTAASKIIGITMTLNGPEGINPTFQTRITPRNTP
ncbi:MAG: prepilin-type N-terminal cleavage/methylation domain-containing protein [Desulfobulbaceae bacterium]|nr:prepilin-type N-terminal cleavage/methylation domain-containing protein [Desulfobulbaceae bacterium]